MSVLIKSMEVGIYCRRRNARSKDDDIERSLLPLKFRLLRQMTNSINNFSPVEDLNIRSSSVVFSQALQNNESFGEKLIGNIEGAKVKEVRSFIVWGNDQEIVVCVDAGLFNEGDYGGERVGEARGGGIEVDLLVEMMLKISRRNHSHGGQSTDSC